MLIKSVIKASCDGKFAEEIFRDTQAPQGLFKCNQCGTCTANCPVTRFTSYNPARLVRDVLVGRVKRCWAIQISGSAFTAIPATLTVCGVTARLDLLEFSVQKRWRRISWRRFIRRFEEGADGKSACTSISF